MEVTPHISLSSRRLCPDHAGPGDRAADSAAMGGPGVARDTPPPLHLPSELLCFKHSFLGLLGGFLVEGRSD